MCALVTGVQTCALPISIGLAVQSFVEVQIRFDAHIEFEAAVLAHPAVVECHTTAGESDYLLKIFARSADHLDELLRHNLSKLPGVQRLKTVVCLKTIKLRGDLADWARTTEGRDRANCSSTPLSPRQLHHAPQGID